MVFSGRWRCPPFSAPRHRPLFSPFNDLVRNAKFGVSVTELVGFPRRLARGKTPAKIATFFGENLLAGGIEPLGEGLKVEQPRWVLNKFCAGIDFYAEPEQVEVQRPQERISPPRRPASKIGPSNFVRRPGRRFRTAIRVVQIEQTGRNPTSKTLADFRTADPASDDSRTWQSTFFDSQAGGPSKSD